MSLPPSPKWLSWPGPPPRTSSPPTALEAGEQVEDVAVVAEDAAVVALTVVDPVVAVAAEDRFGAHRAVDDDVVARAAEVLDAVVAADHEVVAVAADGEVGAEAGSRSTCASLPGPPLRTSSPLPPKRMSSPSPPRSVSLPSLPVEAIVAVVAVQRVVADVRLEAIVARPAVEDDVLAGVQRVEEQLGAVRLRDEHGAVRVGRIERRRRASSASKMKSAVLKTLSIVAGRHGVAAGQLGEGVAFEREAEVQAVGALQVVEAVAVLQVLELLLEDVVERRSEQAAERRLALGEAADPEVDVVEAAGRVRAAGRGRLSRGRREHEQVVRAAAPAPRRAWPRRSPRSVTDGCVPYAAMKLTSDSWCRRPWPNSNQFAVRRQRRVLGSARRAAGAPSLRPGMPSLRPRAMLIAGRSSGRPTSVLRTDEVTNSSSSLPTCFDRPLIRRARRLRRRQRSVQGRCRWSAPDRLAARCTTRD